MYGFVRIDISHCDLKPEKHVSDVGYTYNLFDKGLKKTLFSK